MVATLQCVPIRERLGSGHPNFRGRNHTRSGRKIGQRVDLFPTPHAKDGPAYQEQRQIGADFGGQAKPLRTGKFLLQRPLEGDEGRHRVPRGTTQPAFDRQALLNSKDDLALGVEGGHGSDENSKASVRLVSRNPRVRAANLNPGSAHDFQPQDVMQGNRLVDGAELVKAVAALGPNREAEIDLRKRTHGNGHGRMIVRFHDPWRRPIFQPAAAWPPYTPEGMNRKGAAFALLAVTISVAIAALIAPRTPQPLSYHHFADQRAALGIPNFGDVVSNLAFAVFGA